MRSLGCGLGWAEKKAKFSRIRQVAPICPHGRAHWRHLMNTTEVSVCGGDVVFLSNYFDHLLLFIFIIVTKSRVDWGCAPDVTELTTT